jgi:hypothetical protein
MEEARRQVTPSAAGKPPVPDRESLLAAARVAAQAAYAPYSKFRVGAVVLTDDGQWLLELAPDATIHLDGVDRPWTSRELLPLGFVLDAGRP